MKDTPIFYQCTKDGLPTHYLFGTNHDQVREVLCYQPTLTDAFIQAGLVLTETDTLTEKDRRLLDEFELGRTEAFLEKFALDIAHFKSRYGIKGAEYIPVDQLSPPTQIKLRKLIQAIEKRVSISINTPSLDDRICALAKAAGKFQALGTMSDQIQGIVGSELLLGDFGMYTIFLKHRRSWISSFIAEHDLLTPELFDLMDETTKRYTTQTGLNEQLIPLSAEQQMHLFETRRNKWFEIITPRLDSDSMFIAVGASHLHEGNNFIKRFEALGYQVTPLICPRSTEVLSMDELKTEMERLNSQNMRTKHKPR